MSRCSWSVTRMLCVIGTACARNDNGQLRPGSAPPCELEVHTMAIDVDETSRGCGTTLSRLTSESKSAAISGNLVGSGCRFGVGLAYGCPAAPSSGAPDHIGIDSHMPSVVPDEGEREGALDPRCLHSRPCGERKCAYSTEESRSEKDSGQFGSTGMRHASEGLTRGTHVPRIQAQPERGKVDGSNVRTFSDSEGRLVR